MTNKIIFEDENNTSEFDSQTPCVIVTISGFPEGNGFKEAYTKALDFYIANISDYPTISWLNDMRNMKTARPADVRWIDKNINDRASTLGKRKTAFILPEDRLGKFAVDTYISFTNMRPNNNLIFKSFNNPEEAKKWLKEPIER